MIGYFDIKPTSLKTGRARFSFSYSDSKQIFDGLCELDRILNLLHQTNQLKNKKEMTMKTKIGIVGSRAYTNKTKVKDLIFEIKQKYGNSVEIVSGGQSQGADGFAKKFALMFGLHYVEFPPSHYNWNKLCW